LNGYGRIEITNAGGGGTDGKFSLSELSIETTNTGEDISIELPVILTDSDGDSESTNLDITFAVPGSLALAASEEGSTGKFAGPQVMEAPTNATLLASDTQTVERVAANSNTVALAAAVAAAGVAATSAAASVPAVQDGGPATSVKAFGGPQVMPGLDTGTEGGSALAAFSPLHAGGFEFGTDSLASSSYTAIAASHVGELTAAMANDSGPESLLEATELAAATAVPLPATAMSVAMPTGESLMPAEGGVTAEANGSVAQIIADALNGGASAPSIDALLGALPGQGLGENAGLNGLATQLGDDVPNGDMGHGGVFTFDAAAIITSEAIVLHHDAIQPVANG
jgi:hypothetical protein